MLNPLYVFLRETIKDCYNVESSKLTTIYNKFDSVIKCIRRKEIRTLKLLNGKSSNRLTTRLARFASNRVYCITLLNVYYMIFNLKYCCQVIARSWVDSGAHKTCDAHLHLFLPIGLFTQSATHTKIRTELWDYTWSPLSSS